MSNTAQIPNSGQVNAHPTYAILLAGGQGRRLWPLSRQAFPKQFLTFKSGGQTLLQSAASRAVQVSGSLARVLVLVQAAHADLAREQLPDLPAENLIVEPVGRSTAASIGLAAITLEQRSPGALMAVLPSDHLFIDVSPWFTALRAALAFAAANERLVTIGIQPESPSSSYGYLHMGQELVHLEGCGIYAAQSFVEKPGPLLARDFFESKEYLWNTGTFVWQSGVFLAAVEQHMPALWAGLQRITADPKSLAEVFPTFQDISVDYGIMEKAAGVALVRGDFKRIDVGNLATLSSLLESDSQGNAIEGLLIERDSRDNIVYSDEGLVGLIGLENMIVVRKGDIVLVCPKERAREVKDLVAALGEKGLERFG
jgi:mannose-1-phosphate guanylyltransferase